MDRLLWEYARAKIQRLHILNYNGANMAYNHARDIEKKLGLGREVTPFPAPSSITLEQSQPAPPAKQGISTAGLIGTVAVAGLGPALLGLALLLKGGQPPAPAPSGPDDSAYKVLFYDKDGKPIRVPHIDEREKK